MQVWGLRKVSTIIRFGIWHKNNSCIILFLMIFKACSILFSISSIKWTNRIVCLKLVSFVSLISISLKAHICCVDDFSTTTSGPNQQFGFQCGWFTNDFIFRWRFNYYVWLYQWTKKSIGNIICDSKIMQLCVESWPFSSNFCTVNLEH